VNVLKPQKRITVETLLDRGISHREIARVTGVDRRTIRAIAGAKSPGVATGSGHSGDQNPPLRPPASDGIASSVEQTAVTAGGSDIAGELMAAEEGQTATEEPCETEERPEKAPAPARIAGVSVSACEKHREWIEKQLGLGRNAKGIHEDLVEDHGFTHAYNSVKRFVAGLRARDPERFDVLEFLPGEEAQVDLGSGAPTLYRPGKYKRPWLFVLTLKYSGKSFRATAWKMTQEVWARLHEAAFHALGGVAEYLVLDNLKQGVIEPDIYEPTLNPVYAAMLQHYGAVADPCRVGDPDRKGTVENAIKHTQNTPLKGKRFDSIEAQNEYLAHWEERWAAPRIHGRKKRQVLELYREELPHLRPLPAERFRMFRQETRTVDDAGLIQVAGAYYAALPATVHSKVTVRIYENEIEILDDSLAVIRRHSISQKKGTFNMEPADRIFNPSRETERLLNKARLIGPHTAEFAEELFSRGGRPAHRALYGLTNLARKHARADVETVCKRLFLANCLSYAAVKRALDRLDEARKASNQSEQLNQSGPEIRPISEYQTFWDTYPSD
jgi:transposase